MSLKRKTLVLALVAIIGWLVFAQVCLKMRISDNEAKKEFGSVGLELFTETIDAAGFRLHYVKTGNDTLPTLFFVHGSPGSWMKFKEYLKDKDLQKKYRMVSVDRPGFGYSQFGTVKNLQEQSDILTVLLRKLKNGKPIYASGRSYGGPMIIKLSVDNPGVFSGIVLIAAALDPAAEKPEKWRKLVYETPLNFFVPGAWKVSNEELWHLKDELKILAPQLSTITCPVHILHGDNDGLVPVSNATFIKDMLVNADTVSMTIIPGANHFVSDRHFKLVKETFIKLY